MKSKTLTNYVFIFAFLLMVTISAYNFGIFNDNFVSSQNTNYTKLLETYQEQKKPVVLIAYSESVRYCLEHLQDFKNLSKKYKESLGLIIVNIENSSGMDFANLNEIKVVPSFLLIDAKGDVQKLLQGYVELAELESEITALIKLGGIE
ncbi:MAG: hypothetical protein WCI30_05305 [Clostridia bacterium]